jgi:tetratricopeptide (TPR) repeat protein
LRINSDHRAAERILVAATEALEDGTGDVLEEALLLRWRAYLRGDQSRFKEAIQVLRRAIRLYRRCGETQIASRACISLGSYFGQSGRPQQAVEVLRRALEQLDPEELRWVLACRHNLASNLRRCGELDEALEVLRETRALYSEVGDRMILLHLYDLEGQLARELGHPTEAERAFSSACNGFIDLGIPLDAAFVGLELADLYLEQGRTAEVRRLTSKLVIAFEALETPTEAMAAVALFQQAAESDALTAAVLSEIRARLEQTRQS